MQETAALLTAVFLVMQDLRQLDVSRSQWRVNQSLQALSPVSTILIGNSDRLSHLIMESDASTSSPSVVFT